MNWCKLIDSSDYKKSCLDGNHYESKTFAINPPFNPFVPVTDYYTYDLNTIEMRDGIKRFSNSKID